MIKVLGGASLGLNLVALVAALLTGQSLLASLLISSLSLLGFGWFLLRRNQTSSLRAESHSNSNPELLLVALRSKNSGRAVFSSRAMAKLIALHKEGILKLDTDEEMTTSEELLIACRRNNLLAPGVFFDVAMSGQVDSSAWVGAALNGDDNEVVEILKEEMNSSTFSLKDLRYAARSGGALGAWALNYSQNSSDEKIKRSAQMLMRKGCSRDIGLATLEKIGQLPEDVYETFVLLLEDEETTRALKEECIIERINQASLV